MKTLGIFIGRMNPPHKGHIATIKKALQENDEFLILLGSGHSIDINNPLSYKERKGLLSPYIDVKNIQEIKDTETNKEWTQNIGNIIQNNYDIEKVVFYGGDFENDSAILALKENEKYLKIKNIEYILNPRIKSNIIYKGKKYNISSTNLRKALSEKNNELIKLFVDEKIFFQIKQYFL
ncbi:MAG: adenylyltransferase/cytidyltransferase family protein [Candidatus Gracilibacteria bacterium]|nr:adenylyltransferase/cytidyltransferase family protein [Candidatus Gracilibacteria bacterium]